MKLKDNLTLIGKALILPILLCSLIILLISSSGCIHKPSNWGEMKEDCVDNSVLFDGKVIYKHV